MIRDEEHETRVRRIGELAEKPHRTALEEEELADLRSDEQRFQQSPRTPQQETSNAADTSRLVFPPIVRQAPAPRSGSLATQEAPQGPRTPESSAAAATTVEASGESADVGEYVHAAVVFLLSFVPPAVAKEFPVDVLEDRSLTLITVYFLTLPLALGITAIGLGLQRNWFGTSGTHQFAAVCGILLATTLCGYLGAAVTPGVDATGVHGPPLLVLGVLALKALAGYAFLYGIALFLASILVGCYAAYVANRWLTRVNGPAAATG